MSRARLADTATQIVFFHDVGWALENAEWSWIAAAHAKVRDTSSSRMSSGLRFLTATSCRWNLSMTPSSELKWFKKSFLLGMSLKRSDYVSRSRSPNETKQHAPARYCEET